MHSIKTGRDFTGNVIRRHKACGATTRVHAPGFLGNQHSADEIAAMNGKLRDGAKSFGTARPVFCATSILVACNGCGAFLALDLFVAIYGRFVEEIVCNGKCMNATREICDCSCGGMNHGAGHGVEVAA